MRAEMLFRRWPAAGRSCAAPSRGHRAMNNQPAATTTLAIEANGRSVGALACRRGDLRNASAVHM